MKTLWRALRRLWRWFWERFEIADEVPEDHTHW